MSPATTLSFVLSLLPQPRSQEPTPSIAWQRTLADALAVQQATGLPLLIAVNMDGEVFNDRFRTTTYKDPAFIESTRGYVCVVASPDRHTERDYDSLGNRVECPAFPGCTCGEHIAIEPELFEKYFGGNRNAPRHVGVSPDGKILFDRFLDRSMQTAIDAIAEHRGTPAAPDIPDSVGDLLQRRDAASRRAIEGMYRRSRDPAILDAAGEASNEPFGLLRLALHSEDDGEFLTAAAALAKAATPSALADIENALARSPLIRDRLLDSIRRLAQRDERAARLQAHLTGEDRVIVAPWRNEWRQPAYDITSREWVEAELDQCERGLREAPHDHELRLRLAIAQLAFAQILITTNGKGVEFWLEDAKNSARRIPEKELHAEGQAVIAAACWLSSDAEGAKQAAEAALAGRKNERQPNAWLAAHFFETTVQADTRAAYAKASDPLAVLQPEVARTHAALRLLAASGWTTEDTLLTGIGLLEYAGLRTEARELLFAAVGRFPASAVVHERWRARMTLDFGAEQMRAVAATLAAEASDRATGEWFAGYAAIVAAEIHVRDGRRELAVTAYTDSVDRFATSVELEPGYADSANHFAVLALAGRAMARHELGDSEAAVADLARAAELRKESLRSEDGLKRTPRGIARDIERALEAAGKAELAAGLESIAR